MSAQLNTKVTKTVSITSGKGGVGKTTLVSNLAYALALRGNRVLIFDGDLGMANVDIMFGIKPEGHILEVLNGEKTLNEVITHISPQISLISSGSGITELQKLNPFERRNLIDAMTELEYRYDYLLIDTAPGISENVLYLNAAAQKTNVVITPDPSSLADSYALIKVLNRDYKESSFSIICNQVRDEVEGMSLFNRFNDVVNRFLNVSLDYTGTLAFDHLLKRSTQNQRLIVRHEPTSEPAKSILQMSQRLEKSLLRPDRKSGLQFFWEQAIGVA